MSGSIPLTHKGLPVPYIAPWSLEAVALPRLRVSAGGLAVEGYPHDWAGVSWKPWLERPGQGEPRLGDVHGPRQRLAMQQLRCQVCARPVERNALGYPWLLEDHRGEDGWPEREVTAHPPVCPPCQPVAEHHCDHLRGKVASVRVGRVATDGVYGLLYGPTPHPVPTKKKTVLFTGDPRLRWMLGGQLVATLYDVTIVDMVTQEPVGVARH